MSTIIEEDWGKSLVRTGCQEMEDGDERGQEDDQSGVNDGKVKGEIRRAVKSLSGKDTERERAVCLTEWRRDGWVAEK